MTFVNAVSDGQTITLISDIAGGGFIVNDKEGMSYTIDLNGYTISSDSWWTILTVESGTATIKDGSIINLNEVDPKKNEDGTSDYNTALWVKCKATLSNLNIISKGKGAITLFVDGSDKVTMSRCKVEATEQDFDDSSFAMAAFFYKAANVSATKCEFYAKEGDRAIETNVKTVLNNCKASAKNYSIIAFEGANVQIKKGTYKACISIEEKAKATINDGYFKDVEVPLVVGGNVTIKAGKFYGADNAVYVDGGKVTVKKGYFSASSGKAWASTKYSKQLDKVFKISNGSKVAQSKWKTGNLSTISVKIK